MRRICFQKGVDTYYIISSSQTAMACEPYQYHKWIHMVYDHNDQGIPMCRKLYPACSVV